MGAPVIETIRAGVAFVPAAAASFRRAEAEWVRRTGRRIDVNSTYRDYNLQLSMYYAWNAYKSGDGPYPGHSRALHPDLSMHCRGLALDSDDWASDGFIELMAEYGWIRTAAGDPSERHHFEYQSWRDRHQGELAGDAGELIEEEEDEMKILYLFIEGDAGAKGVIGTVNRAFRNPTERAHFQNVWGVPGAAKNGAQIGVVTTSAQFVSDLIRIHSNSDVFGSTQIDVAALAKSLGPLLKSGASVADIEAALKDDFDTVNASVKGLASQIKEADQSAVIAAIQNLPAGVVAAIKNAL